MHNRSVRCCKIVYEALNYLLIETMEENIGSLLDFEKEICDSTYEDHCDHDVTKRFINVFNGFHRKISNKKDTLSLCPLLIW